MKGEQKSESRRRRTGEKPRVRQPLKVDTLPAEARDAIQQARAGTCGCNKRKAHGHTWEETAELASKIAGVNISMMACHRWYDIRVEQVTREALEDSRAAHELGEAFKQLPGSPEAAINALYAEAFKLLRKDEPKARREALATLALMQSKLLAAQAASKRAEIDEEKVSLAKKKFEDLKSKAEKATDEAAAKIGKGKDVTLADINRIREKFGLPPAAAAGH